MKKQLRYRRNIFSVKLLTHETEMLRYAHDNNQGGIRYG